MRNPIRNKGRYPIHKNANRQQAVVSTITRCGLLDTNFTLWMSCLIIMLTQPAYFVASLATPALKCTVEDAILGDS